jgi:hypothetical protein
MSEIAGKRPEPNATLCCPTCGAWQAPSQTCRLCRCDLALLLRFRAHGEHLRDRCLGYLRQRRVGRATAVARQYYQFSPDSHSASLLGTCYLLGGNFADAIRLYSRSKQDSDKRMPRPA